MERLTDAEVDAYLRVCDRQGNTGVGGKIIRQIKAERDALIADNARLREALNEFAALDKWVTDSLQEAGADIPDDEALKRFKAMEREWFGAGVGASFAESLSRARAALGAS